MIRTALVDIEEDENCNELQSNRKIYEEKPISEPKSPLLLRPESGNDQHSIRLEIFEAKGWKKKISFEKIFLCEIKNTLIYLISEKNSVLSF